MEAAQAVVRAIFCPYFPYQKDYANLEATNLTQELVTLKPVPKLFFLPPPPRQLGEAQRYNP